MTRLPEIWSCIIKKLPRNKWVSLGEIYFFIESSIQLDDEDFEPQSPTSDVPKWKRNVRNVLQYRKSKNEIVWDGKAQYKIK